MMDLAGERACRRAATFVPCPDAGLPCPKSGRRCGRAMASGKHSEDDPTVSREGAHTAAPSFSRPIALSGRCAYVDMIDVHVRLHRWCTLERRSNLQLDEIILRVLYVRIVPIEYAVHPPA